MKNLEMWSLFFISNAFNKAKLRVQDTYLNVKKIAHFDIKTKNVLISDDDRALVSDFGLFTSIEKSSSAYMPRLSYHSSECCALE